MRSQTTQDVIGQVSTLLYGQPPAGVAQPAAESYVNIKTVHWVCAATMQLCALPSGQPLRLRLRCNIVTSWPCVSLAT